MTIAGTDRLRANFRANAWAGRIEGGYRFVLPVSGGVGLAPYAAVQAALFDQPGYSEQVVSGASTFALGYAGKRATDNRSELGLRSDKSFALPECWPCAGALPGPMISTRTVRRLRASWRCRAPVLR